MRKDIDPALYNYNKYPGPEFQKNGDMIETDKIHFQLKENHKEAFDLTVFNQRFSEILTKFDYLVGDWGNEQLRLKGFYKDERKEASENKISRLEDYLLEYCNFGCAYFVLENLEPHRAAFDKKNRKKKEDSNKKGRTEFQAAQEKKRKRTDQKFEKKSNKPKKKRTQKNNKGAGKTKEGDSNRHFVIRKKEDK